jgi:hypothetical protein
VPVDRVAGLALVVGDVVRLGEPQAHRVERVMIADGQVVLEVAQLASPFPETVRVKMPAEGISDRLGSVGD